MMGSDSRAPVHVIGANGFIGSAVQRVAHTLDIPLRCWTHQDGAEHGFDLLRPASWSALQEAQPETVMLLAWPGLPNFNASFHLTRNLPLTLQLLETLLKSGTRRVVGAGTCYEYGLKAGALEEHTPTEPVNFYAAAKDATRRGIAMLCEPREVTWSWLRIFYPYGPGQNPLSLLPSLQRAIAAGETVFPMGSGDRERDFIAVETVARQLLILSTHPHAAGVYNGGTGNPQTVKAFLKDQIANSNATITLQVGGLPDRPDEPPSFWANPERMKALLDTPVESQS